MTSLSVCPLPPSQPSATEPLPRGMRIFTSPWWRRTGSAASPTARQAYRAPWTVTRASASWRGAGPRAGEARPQPAGSTSRPRPSPAHPQLRPAPAPLHSPLGWSPAHLVVPAGSRMTPPGWWPRSVICGSLLQLLLHGHALVLGPTLRGVCCLEGTGWGPSGGRGGAAAAGGPRRLRGALPEEARPRRSLVSALGVAGESGKGVSDPVALP